MKYGYARTSIHQPYAMTQQVDALTAAGCDHVISEVASSGVELIERALATQRFKQDDELCVTGFDRVARDAEAFARIAGMLDRAGVRLHSLRQASPPSLQRPAGVTLQ